MKTVFQYDIKAAGKGCRGLIKRLAESNYYSARAYYKYQLRRSTRKHKGPPIMIYQMGKVGSETVQKSLSVLELDSCIYHVHFLTEERIAEIEEERRKYFRTDKYHLLQRPWLYQFLRKQAEHGLNGRKWKIVTLTREPIARNISTFFENVEVNLIDSGSRCEIKSDYYHIDPTIVKLDDMRELQDLFFDRLNHDSPLVFFDRELKGVFGIDVFASEFPKSKGYKIYMGKHADVLLIRVENLNERACNAFKEFLNIENFSLINTNVGSKKDYASVYRKFKESIALPGDYIDRMYGSKYMRHFYSDEEIDRFATKWRSSGT